MTLLFLIFLFDKNSAVGLIIRSYICYIWYIHRIENIFFDAPIKFVEWNEKKKKKDSHLDKKQFGKFFFLFSKMEFEHYGREARRGLLNDEIQKVL